MHEVQFHAISTTHKKENSNKTPALLIRTYAEESKARRDTCVSILIIGFICSSQEVETVAKSLADEWLSKTKYAHTRDYY